MELKQKLNLVLLWEIQEVVNYMKYINIQDKIELIAW